MSEGMKCHIPLGWEGGERASPKDAQSMMDMAGGLQEERKEV